jgi:hypothetical protein
MLEVVRFDSSAIILLLLLMPLNWGLEVIKWHFIANKFVSLSWQSATSGVLNGLAMGFITPHAVGDYIGRIEQMPEGDKVEMGGMVMLSRMVQMIATFVFGLWGVFTLFRSSAFFFGGIGLIVLCIPIWIITRPTGVIQWPRLIARFIYPLQHIGRADIGIIMILAFARYLIFGFQLTWAIYIFAGVPFQLAASGTTWILLFKSIAPVFNFLSDLGVREASAVLFYENQGVDYLPVVLASLLIWCINILLPTLAGALNILRVK